MRYLILVSLLVGCSPPVVDNRVDDILSKVQSDNVTQTALLLDKFDNLNIKLDAVKIAIETIPTGAAVPPEPPSTPSQATPSAAPVFESKPVLYVSYTKFCLPCRKLKKDIEAGKFNDFVVKELPDDTWEQGYPVIRWKQDDKWMYLVRDAVGFNGEPIKTNRGYDSEVVKDLKTVHGIQ
jgi:hypothetical protein